MQKELAGELLRNLKHYYEATTRQSLLSEKTVKVQYYKKVQTYKINDLKEVEEFLGMIIDQHKYLPSIFELNEIYASYIKKKTQTSAYSKDRFEVKINCEVCDGTGVVFHPTNLGDECLYCDFCRVSEKFVKDLSQLGERPSPYYMKPASTHYEGKQADRINPFEVEKTEKVNVEEIIKKMKEIGDGANIKIAKKYQSDMWKSIHGGV